MTQPDPVFGGAFFGLTFKNAEELKEPLEVLQKHGIKRVDTAARYPPSNQGQSERMLGQNKAAQNGFLIDTKVLMGFNDGSGELAAPAVAESIKQSLDRLGVSKVNTLYCHRFDPATPLIETAAAFDQAYRQGAFERWGICHFDAKQLEEMLNICEQHDYVKPKVFQNEYNVISRAIEDDFLPLLRKHNMVFYAQGVFARGFLTGKFTRGEYQETRFADDHELGHVFRNQYKDQNLHEAVKDLEALVRPHGITTHEAALRWAMFHSCLGANDGLIFACSKIEQIEDNAATIQKGPLPNDVVSFMDGMWLKYAQDQTLPTL